MTDYSTNYSRFGLKLSAQSGISSLMDDLGMAMTLRPDILMLGGGNPAAIEPVMLYWRDQTLRMLEQTERFDKMVGNYDPPQGNPEFLDAFAGLFSNHFGWPITAENVIVANGAQTGVFSLLNLLAGTNINGVTRKILIPLSPDYIGYADMGIEDGMFIACQGTIVHPDPNDCHTFKYIVDFDAVERVLETEPIAAMLISRPTNPSGNVVSDAEVRRLDALAAKHGIPLIIDNAYGCPFPCAVSDSVLHDGTYENLDRPFYSPNTIQSFSLSKLGLPGIRTAFIVAPAEIIRSLSAMTAIIGLANGNFGQRLSQSLFQTGEIIPFVRTIHQPFYQQKRTKALEILARQMNRFGVSWQVHRSEGAFFLWLWLDKLSIPTAQLYQTLKDKGVLVIPGENFFFGQPDTVDEVLARHRQQCLRISFCASEQAIEEGLGIIAQTVASTV